MIPIRGECRVIVELVGYTLSYIGGSEEIRRTGESNECNECGRDDYRKK